MSRLFLVLTIITLAIYNGYGQSAPLITIDKAAAEFISDNARPKFIVKRISVVGRVDTMKAVVKTSTLRSVKGEYSRYKPVVDSIWWTSRDSLHHDVFVRSHLEGQDIPLPSNSVRGSMRMTVSAAYWSGEDWVGTSSEAFTVPVANVDIPRPNIAQSGMEVAREKETPRSMTFTITGLRLLKNAKDTVDFMPEIRTFNFGDVTVEYLEGSLVTSDPATDSLRSVDVSHTVSSKGDIVINGTIHRPMPRAGKKAPSISSATFSVVVKARLVHNGTKGPLRTRTIEVSLFE